MARNRTRCDRGEPDGEIFLVERATGYEVVRLGREWIADVEIVTDTTVHLTETHRPGLMLGVPLGGLVGGLALAGRATTTAKVAERHGVALRYQKTADGALFPCAIPFGGDRDGAVSLKLVLDRLRRHDQASARATTDS